MGFFYDRLIRPALFTLSSETAHDLGLCALKAAAVAPVRPLLKKILAVNDPALQMEAAGLTFKNPVGLAAGCDKNAEALEGLEALGFGFFETGTLTPRPQPGNPRPRLFRFPHDSALINRLGFNNVGVDDVARRFRAGRSLSIPLGFNIGKNKDTPLEKAAEDYLLCLERLRPWADFFVVNVSSPNTPGLRSLQSPKDLEPLLQALKKKNDSLSHAAAGRKAPALFVKVSPDEDAYEEMVEVAARAGFSGIVAVNTTKSREGLSTSFLDEGGLSGRPLRAKSTAVIRRLYKAARGRLTIIGVGGVFSAEDAYEKILAGASLVEVYTGFIYKGPGLVREINQGLLRLLRRDGFLSIQAAVGKKA